jgi:L-amino acid N-acyltransferase
MIRDATREDMADVCDLYNALIPTTTVAWTETPEHLDERLAWFETQQLRGWPVVVAVESGSVVGFAAYGSFRGDGKWPGYRFTVEHTIHVAQSHWGTGIGRALVDELISHAYDSDVHVMVGAIDADNEASLRFHKRLGFVEVARMPQVGRKFDRWRDLIFVQRIIADRS